MNSSQYICLTTTLQRKRQSLLRNTKYLYTLGRISFHCWVKSKDQVIDGYSLGLQNQVILHLIATNLFLGSSFHKDPNATSAWNGLISGRKKWIMFPPDVVPPGVFPSDDGWDVSTPESVIEWFADFYKEIKHCSVQPIECVLKPGELLFIPSRWWHLALNLEVALRYS